MKTKIISDDIKPIDFAGGVRGKHYSAYTKGYTVKEHLEDGSTIVHKFVPERGAVVIDSDVRSYFNDAKAVNEALRGLINLLPHRQKNARTA